MTADRDSVMELTKWCAAQMQYAARRGFYLVLPASRSSNGTDVPPQLPRGWLSTETRSAYCLVMTFHLVIWSQTEALNCLDEPLFEPRSTSCLCSKPAVVTILQGVIISRQRYHPRAECAELAPQGRRQ